MKVKTTRNPQGVQAAPVQAVEPTPPPAPKVGQDEAKVEAEKLALALKEESDRLSTAQAGSPLELPLRDGRVVTMQRPKAVYTLRLYRLLGQDSANEALDLIYRGIFHVTKVGDSPVHAPATELELEHIAGMLQDQGLEEVATYYVRYFSPRAEVVRPL